MNETRLFASTEAKWALDAQIDEFKAYFNSEKESMKGQVF